MAANDKQVGGDHYRTSGRQHWDLVAIYKIGYLEGCATKYLVRWRRKNGLVDLEKALHFTDKLIELAEGGLRPGGEVPLDKVMWLSEEHGLSPTEDTAVTLLLRWQTISDLQSARLAIQRLVWNEQQRLQSIGDEFVQGTPEDGGQHARQGD